MKKKLSFLLLICILNALSINAEIYSGSCGDNVSYTLDTSNGLLSITGTGAMKNYSSSSSVPWYSNRSDIKSILIANGVTSIGHRVFYGCSNLTWVSIPNSVNYIGDSAFRECSGLTSVTIPNSVVIIEHYAFYQCTGLTSIDIPNSVTSIGNYAFYQCSNLSSITIPNSLTSIGLVAFDGTTWYDNQPNGFVYLGLVAYKYKGDLSWNESLLIQAVTLGIAGGAFASQSMKSVTIPNSVKTIGHQAFANCQYLTSIDIPNSVTSIANYAFYQCSNLTSATIGNSVTSIGMYAFAYCSNLKYIICEATSVSSKGSDAFKDISGRMLDVTSSAAEEYKTTEPWSQFGSINAVSEEGNIISGSCGKNVNYTLNLETGVLSITGTGAMKEFSNGFQPWYYKTSYIKTVNIADGVISVGSYAFYNCSNLASVTIGNSVTSIGRYAFDGTAWFNNQPDGLVYAGLVAYKYKGTMPLNTSVTIEEGTLGITEYAFNGCSGLTSVTIPNSVTSVGESAFGGTAWYNNQPDGLVYAGLVAYKYKGTMPENTSITIAEGTLSIAGSAFYGRSSLKSVTIPNSVTSIGNFAFYNCSGLTEVYCYAENVPTTSSSAFQGVTLNSATLYVLDSSKDDYSASAPWSGFGTIESLKANATLGTNGFTTFAYRYPLDLSNAKLPTGVKAYKASSISGTTVYFTEFDQTVPANTGILLEGPASETVGILVAASGTDVASNEFHVNETGETFAAEPGYTYYGLIKNSDPLTFGTFAPASVAMPSNKAYLMVAGGGNSARSMRTVFGSGITGLNETKSALDTTVKNGAYLEKGRIVIYKAGNKFNATGAQIK